MLKINGTLTRIVQGVRPGCSLSGVLYTLSIDPLLRTLRRNGVSKTTKVCLTAYADDIAVVHLNTGLNTFERASSAQVN